MTAPPPAHRTSHQPLGARTQRPPPPRPRPGGEEGPAAGRSTHMTDSYPLDPAEAFGRLGRIKLGETDLKGVLDEVAHLAKHTIPGADEVSVTLISAKDARTAAYTGQPALSLDEWQYGKGHGPCIDASAPPATLSLPDMATEDRWPDWASRALEEGVHSSLSIGM